MGDSGEGRRTFVGLAGLVFDHVDKDVDRCFRVEFYFAVSTHETDERIVRGKLELDIQKGNAKHDGA